MTQKTAIAKSRMPKELKAKWLEALRSGKYRQGMARLRDQSGGYCCLGVLQEALDGQVEMLSEEMAQFYPTQGWSRDHGLDPGDSFDANHGFDPDLVINGIKARASHHNDGSGDVNSCASFAEIADAIEAQVEGV